MLVQCPAPSRSRSTSAVPRWRPHSSTTTAGSCPDRDIAARPPSPTGNSGHIGHVEVGGFDDACACGGRGCLEAVASGPNTVAWARRQGFAGTTGEDLAVAHAAGDPIAIAAVERAGTAIGHAVASAANLVDLDVAAIGGGFSRVSPALFDHARAALRVRTAFPFVSRVRIVPSGLSDEGPLIGAAALVHRPDLLT